MNPSPVGGELSGSVRALQDRAGVSRPGWYQRYGTALLAVALATGVRFALNPLLGGQAPYEAFYFSTLISVYAAGRGPGILATLLGALLGMYFFVPPQFSFSIELPNHAVWLTFYCVISAGLIWRVAMHRARSTRLEEAHRSLQREDASLRNQQALIDLSHEAIIFADASRRITSWNFGAQELYGWSAAEATGRIIHELLNTEGTVTPAECDAILWREGRWDGELSHTSRDGRRIVVESRQALVRDAAGQVLGIVEINRDITERKRTEQELRNSQHRLTLALRAGSAGSFEWIRETNTNSWSDELLALYGFQPGEFGGRYEDWVECVFPDDREPATAAFEQALSSGEFHVEFRIRRHDTGEVRWMDGRAQVLFDERGQASRMIGINVDITERRMAEERLRQTQKFESIGLLAGGIAHDFNNLLAGIMGNASLLENEVADEQRERVEGILEASRRAADLTRQLLAYAGKGKFVLDAVDLSQAVRNMTDLLNASIPKRIPIRQSLTANLPPIMADPGQVQQLLMNLVLNAAEAADSGHGAMISICTSVAEILPQNPVIDEVSHESLQPGLYVCLEVSDTGTGIDASTRARMFDPFFSTKFAGRGLGLAAVAGIARAYRGGIDVLTEQGRGTTFRILFPAVGRRSRPEPQHSLPASDGTATVLVVDDEAMLRKFTALALEQFGYTVLTAAAGAEALHIFEQNADSISVVVLDLNMPGMTGVETFRALRKRWPDVKVVLVSGYSESEAVEMFGQQGLSAFLQKPFTAHRLASEVHSVLEPKHRSPA